MTAQLCENVATLGAPRRGAHGRAPATEHRAGHRQRGRQALAKQLDFTAILEAVGERAAEALSAKGFRSR